MYRLYRCILTFSIAFILSTVCSAQWEILNQSESFTAVDFINSRTGWLAGYGSLMKTENGGGNWEFLPTSREWNIIMMDFVNESTGWAITYDSYTGGLMIIKTADGGQNWTNQNHLPGYWIRGLDVIDETIVYAMADTVLLRTTDGGSTWNEISVGNNDIWFSSIWFVNGDQGIVAGMKTGNSEAGIWKTYDGGINWQEKTLSNFISISQIHFCNDSTGYFVGNMNSGEIVLCQTIDFGESWSIKLRSQYGINSLCCLNEDTIFCVMVDSTGSVDLLKSVDGGDNWKKQTNSDSRTLIGGNILFVSSQIGFMISDQAFFYRTIDGGVHWKIQFLGLPFNDVVFLDKNKGFICGWRMGLHSSRGDLLVTEDLGKTWDIKFNVNDILHCFFVNRTIGYLLSGHNIQKTMDGGNKWLEYIISDFDSNGIFFQGNDLYFIDEMTGWAVGFYYDSNTNGASIFKTHNGGEKWKLTSKYPNSDPNKNYILNSIHFLNENIGWAVGESGLILKYLPLYDHWVTVENVTDLPLKKVLFTDPKTGWISGEYNDGTELHSVLLKSLNGGLTWSDQNFKYLINDIYFSDPFHGWVVGSDTTNRGIILATQNGGEQWQIQLNNLTAPLNAIHFSNDNGWAVGDHGLIVRTENSGSSWIVEDPDQYNFGYNLNQNYPNPFNPCVYHY